MAIYRTKQSAFFVQDPKSAPDSRNNAVLTYSFVPRTMFDDWSTPVVLTFTFSHFEAFRSFRRNLTVGNDQVSFEYKEMMSQIYLRNGEIGGPKDFKV